MKLPIADIQIKPNRIRKSLAAERTFNEYITSEIFMLKKLEDIAKEVEKRLKKRNRLILDLRHNTNILSP